MGNGVVQGEGEMGLPRQAEAEESKSRSAGFRLLSPAALLFSYAVLAALLALTFLFHESPPDVARQQLATFPKELGGFRMVHESTIPPNVLKILQPTDTVVRAYARRPDEPPISFYIAYHADQSEGSRVHSPKSCLPGAGWRIVEIRRIPVPWKGGEAKVNLVRVEKGLDTQIALYWIQSNGRVIANEYLARAYIFHDLFLRHRSDGGLVRFMTTLTRDENEDDAKERILALALPTLKIISRYIPD